MMFAADTDEICEAFVEANFDQSPSAMREAFYEWLANKWEAAYMQGRYDQKYDVQQVNSYSVD